MATKEITPIDETKAKNCEARGRQRGQRRLQRRLHQSARRHGSRAQTSRHVHRFHRRDGTAPSGLRSRGQLGRRSARWSRRQDRSHHPPRQLHHGRRQRSRHSGRHDGHRRRKNSCRASCADQTARRRKVRCVILQSFRRIARRRRFLRQRLERRTRSRNLARRIYLGADLFEGRSHQQAEESRRKQEARHQGSLPARPNHLHRHRIQLRHAGAAPARTGIPEQGPADHAHRRAHHRREDPAKRSPPSSNTTAASPNSSST